MRQLVLPPEYSGRGPLSLSGSQSHHITRVLRLKAGDEVRGRDASGRLILLRITAAEPDHVVLEPRRVLEETGIVEPLVTLLQCIPKGRKLDQIVRQAVEAGVSRIVPVHSEHTLVKLEDESKVRSRLDRLSRIAREAREQCGGSRPTEILAPVELSRLKGEPDTLGIFLHERRLATPPGSPPLEGPSQTGYSAAPTEAGQQLSLHDVLASAGPGTRVNLLVGPEGGLSPADVKHLLSIGYLPVYLGPRVLRVETAAVFALGAILVSLLERDRWNPK